jgi:hypothetical protein
VQLDRRDGDDVKKPVVVYGTRSRATVYSETSCGKESNVYDHIRFRIPDKGNQPPDSRLIILNSSTRI